MPWSYAFINHLLYCRYTFICVRPYLTKGLALLLRYRLITELNNYRLRSNNFHKAATVGLNACELTMKIQETKNKKKEINKANELEISVNGEKNVTLQSILVHLLLL